MSVSSCSMEWSEVRVILFHGVVRGQSSCSMEWSEVRVILLHGVVRGQSHPVPWSGQRSKSSCSMKWSEERVILLHEVVRGQSHPVPWSGQRSVPSCSTILCHPVICQSKDFLFKCPVDFAWVSQLYPRITLCLGLARRGHTTINGHRWPDEYQRRFIVSPWGGCLHATHLSPAVHRERKNRSPF